MDAKEKDKLFTGNYLLMCLANFLTAFSFFLLLKLMHLLIYQMLL